MNHKRHETFYSTFSNNSLKKIIRRILTTDQPLQRLWKVNTFPILIFFFWKLHNSKKKKQRMVAGAIKLAHLAYLTAWFCMSHQSD